MVYKLLRHSAYSNLIQEGFRYAQIYIRGSNDMSECMFIYGAPLFRFRADIHKL